MKEVKRNWYLSIGMLIIAAVLIFKQFFTIPDLVQGFAMGLGLALELIGAYTVNHDIKRLKNFKRNLFRAFVK